MSRFPPNGISSLLGKAPRYPLAGSTSRNVAIGDILPEPVWRKLAEIRLDYGSAQGARELRELVAADVGIDPDEIIVTVGATLALFLIAFELSIGGERPEAIVCTPGYPAAIDGLYAAGFSVTRFTTRFEDGYQIDPDRLASAMGPRTRLISIATPHNPSGRVQEPDRVAAIHKAMLRRAPSAYLLVDETYREACYAAPPPSVASWSERILTTSSLSKAYGVPGLRIGWLTVRDPGLRARIIAARMNLVDCTSAIDEYIATETISRKQTILSKQRIDMLERRDIVEQWVVEQHDLLEWLKPDAGGLCCVRLRPALFDDDAVDRVYADLEAYGVSIGDGVWFGESRRVFRLGFGAVATPLLNESLPLITDVLRA